MIVLNLFIILRIFISLEKRVFLNYVFNIFMSGMYCIVISPCILKYLFNPAFSAFIHSGSKFQTDLIFILEVLLQNLYVLLTSNYYGKSPNFQTERKCFIDDKMTVLKEHLGLIACECNFA